MTLLASFVVLISAFSVRATAPSGPWDQFNYAPSTRVVLPTAVHSSFGSVTNGKNLVGNKGMATLTGNGSWIALDFGKEVGGLISLNLNSVTNTSAFALSFTESPEFIRPTASDDSALGAPSTTYDGVLSIRAPLPSGFWTQPVKQLRGGFRYLSIVSNSNSPITLSNVSCSISFMPHVTNMRNYSGYFSTIDPVFHDPNFLTKLWYAGAYTVQTNTVPLNTGRASPAGPPGTWSNAATLGVAGPIIVDGAKRDRAVWPGDMGIAVPTQFVSTNDLIPTRNALSTMFSAIASNGALPESGPPLSQTGSDTYHMWTLIGTHNYYTFSGDIAWLQTVWTNYTRAVAFVEAKVTSSGLMNVTGLRDWARLGGGGLNSEGNALLYKVLTNSADLATTMNQPALASAWSANATALKTVFNQAFWVPELGMYRDNQTTTLCPQDANSMAVIFGLTTPAQATSVSAGLQKNWNDLGPVAPELPDTISPFISGLELQAHFMSGNDARAMDLIRREWGYMLYTNLSVQSSLLEGFTANGSLSYRSYRGYSYDPAYTSHAHGWSSGPTSALTYFVLGLQVTSPKGQTWTVAPHLSGLPEAQGGFETPLGTYNVSWATILGAFSLNITAPTGTTGTVTLPVKGKLVTVDGKVAKFNADGTISLKGGKHAILVIP
ncbi:Six-hairpin glycosidase [Rickenella mellea]|uniref:Six-hairpin glycosidase n=1 Tax=Rickenella mellea TaxID=50990 RepID=A0A4Y7QGS1_9AGAM|nr:Six-hairpin glycosidase [Rickenella mellea]